MCFKTRYLNWASYLYLHFTGEKIMRNGAHHSGTVSGVIVACARTAMDHPGRQHLRIADYLYRDRRQNASVIK